MLHDLTVNADLIKDFFPRVIQPILSTMIIITFVTAYLFKIIGFSSLSLPLSIILTLIINYSFANFQDVDDTNYREKLLDFHDGCEELINAGSSDIIIEKLNEESEKLCRTEQINRNKITNIDSICAVINAAAFVWIFSELATRVDLIDLAVWIFILILNLELLSTLPITVRHLIKINRINKKFSLPQIAASKQKIFNEDQSNALIIKNLCFGYSSSNKVIKNLSLEINRGDKVSIIGESGSGKTTLLYLILNLWTPDFGEIIVNGRIAAATTNNYIFSNSIRENFKLLLPHLTEDKIYSALKICQLEGFDIDREIGVNGCKISGGERNRLQTALALAADTDILILDEPTAGLDKVTKINLMREIINYTNEKDRTLIVITHDLYVAKLMNITYKFYDKNLVKIICED